MTSYFKNRYDSDPAYRAKHLAYVSEKVTCPCGTKTSRCNMSKHLKSQKHQSWKTNQELQQKLTQIESILTKIKS